MPDGKPEFAALYELRIALAESVRLQSHYAKLLNMHDGGKRMQFDSSDQWISRLYEIGVIKTKLANLQARYDSISHFCEVMRFCAEHDMTSHIIVHVGDDSKLEVAADCSDCFWWGCADAEEITSENFQLFRDTVTECESLDASSENFASLYAGELFAARVRKMRPQGASYELYHPALWPLFNACGPERTCEYGNPHKYPTDPSEWKGFKAQRRQTYDELKAERDRLASELAHVDGVLARRPALEDVATRGGKIERAINFAAKYDGASADLKRLAESHRELLVAIKEYCSVHHYWGPNLAAAIAKAEEILAKRS